MVTTQQARYDWADIIRGFVTDTSSRSYGKPLVRTGGDVVRKVRFETNNPSWWPKGYVDLSFHREAADVFRAVASCMLEIGYTFDHQHGGSLVPRNITAASPSRIAEQVRLYRDKGLVVPLATSLHAHGIAVDINPDRNPYLPAPPPKYDYPPALIEAWRNIRNRKGQRLLTLGLDWTKPVDSMHLEARDRAACEVGVDFGSVLGWDRYLYFEQHGERRNDSVFDPVITKEASPSAIVYLQLLLEEAGYGTGLVARDGAGVYGPATEAAMRSFGNQNDALEGGEHFKLIIQAARRGMSGGGAVPEHAHDFKIDPDAFRVTVNVPEVTGRTGGPR